MFKGHTCLSSRQGNPSFGHWALLKNPCKNPSSRGSEIENRWKNYRFLVNFPPTVCMRNHGFLRHWYWILSDLFWFCHVHCVWMTAGNKQDPFQTRFLRNWPPAGASVPDTISHNVWSCYCKKNKPQMTGWNPISLHVRSRVTLCHIM